MLSEFNQLMENNRNPSSVLTNALSSICVCTTVLTIMHHSKHFCISDSTLKLHQWVCGFPKWNTPYNVNNVFESYTKHILVKWFCKVHVYLTISAQRFWHDCYIVMEFWKILQCSYFFGTLQKNLSPVFIPVKFFFPNLCNHPRQLINFFILMKKAFNFELQLVYIKS